MRRSFALAFAGLVLLLAAPAAQARDATDHVLRRDPDRPLLPPVARAAAKAPTILQGHGWGGSRQTNPEAASDEATGNVGVGALRKAGFNVLTWDSARVRRLRRHGHRRLARRRGARRAGAARLARQAARGAARQGRRPARRHDRRLLRGRDRARHRRARQAHRRDRPDHRLAQPDYARSTRRRRSRAAGRPLLVRARACRPPRAAWTRTSRPRSPPALTTGTLSDGGPRLVRRRAAPATSSSRSRSRRSSSRAPRTRCSRSTRRSPTTRSSRRNGVPAKMMWFCGGHGVCLTGAGPAGHIEDAVVAWLKRYVAKRRVGRHRPGASSGSADDAQWRSTDATTRSPRGAPGHRDRLRHARAQPRRRRLAARSLTAGRARQRVQRRGHRARREPDRRRAAARSSPTPGTGNGHPRLRAARRRGARRRASATRRRRSRSRSTASRTRSRRPLEAIAASAPAGSKYTLQLTGGTLLYGPVRGAAALTFSQGRPDPADGRRGRRQRRRGHPPAHPHVPRRGASSRSACRARSPKVTVAGKRVKVNKGRAVDRPARQAEETVKVKVTVKRKGKTVRETRRYNTCTAKTKR